MHAQPPRTLKRLLKQYGQELIDDPRRTEALLRDHCGQHTREIFVLVNAQKQRVPAELLAAPAWMPRQATYSRLSRLLQTKLAITDDAADWAVASWANALGLEGQGKSDAWSWLPGQARSTTASSRGSKSRGKKRHKSSSGVQYSKRKARDAKARGQRAELGGAFPVLDFTRWLQLTQSPFGNHVTWANLLPWLALLSATIFLLAVVYWTSSTRNVPVVAPVTTEGEAATTALSEPQAQTATAVATAAGTVAGTVAPPTPELPEPPAVYLTRVMELPTWANVNVGDAPLLIRAEPSTQAQFLNVLQDGTAVSVVAFYSDGKWAQIESPQAGWVSNDFLRYHSTGAPNSAMRLGVQQLQARYDTKVLAAPSATAAEVATLARDDRVIVAASIGEPVTWYQLADPVVGWVAASDLAAIVP